MAGPRVGDEIKCQIRPPRGFGSYSESGEKPLVGGGQSVTSSVAMYYRGSLSS